MKKDKLLTSSVILVFLIFFCYSIFTPMSKHGMNNVLELLWLFISLITSIVYYLTFNFIFDKKKYSQLLMIVFLFIGLMVFVSVFASSFRSYETVKYLQCLHRRDGINDNVRANRSIDGRMRFCPTTLRNYSQVKGKDGKNYSACKFHNRFYEMYEEFDGTLEGYRNGVKLDVLKYPFVSVFEYGFELVTGRNKEVYNNPVMPLLITIMILGLINPVFIYGLYSRRIDKFTVGYGLAFLFALIFLPELASGELLNNQWKDVEITYYYGKYGALILLLVLNPIICKVLSGKKVKIKEDS